MAWESVATAVQTSAYSLKALAVGVQDLMKDGGSILTLTYYGSYAWIVWQAVGGAITLGDMTLYLGIFRSSQSTFESIFYGLSELYENGLFMSNLFKFLELEPQMVVAAHPARVPARIARGIEFRNVSFEYVDGVPVLKQVSFHAPAGSTTALVREVMKAHDTMIIVAHRSAVGFLLWRQAPHPTALLCKAGELSARISARPELGSLCYSAKFAVVRLPPVETWRQMSLPHTAL